MVFESVYCICTCTGFSVLYSMVGSKFLLWIIFKFRTIFGKNLSEVSDVIIIRNDFIYHYLFFILLLYFLFSIKVIFGRVITFYIKKGLTVLQLYFICCISCINIAEECLLCFRNKSNAVYTLLVLCF